MIQYNMQLTIFTTNKFGAIQLVRTTEALAS